jgi:hypothetical protein
VVRETAAALRATEAQMEQRPVTATDVYERLKISRAWVVAQFAPHSDAQEANGMCPAAHSAQLFVPL